MSNEIHSEQINEISAALAKAQSEIKFAEKDGENPHYKSAFATLGSHLEVCKEVLGKNNLMVTQLSTFMDTKHVLVTILSHSSGQWFKSYYPLNPVKNDPQGMGSCLTYARRYMLSAIVGTAAQDDDGNEACNEEQKRKEQNLKKRNDYVTKPNNSVSPTIPQESIEKIDDSQVHTILESLAQTDDAFKKEFYHKLLHSYQVHHLNEMPLNRFASALQWIKYNIERIKNENN